LGRGGGVGEEIIKHYVEMRSRAKGGSIPITPRQLEAFIRLAEASARLRLSETVEVEDAIRAIELVESSLRDIALDPETGEIDIDYVFSGTPKTQRDKILIVKSIIENLQESYDRGVPKEEIVRMAEEQGIDASKVEEILKKLSQVGEVYKPRYGYYRLVSE